MSMLQRPPSTDQAPKRSVRVLETTECDDLVWVRERPADLLALAVPENSAVLDLRGTAAVVALGPTVHAVIA